MAKGLENITSPAEEVKRNSLQDILSRLVKGVRINAKRAIDFCVDIGKKCVHAVNNLISGKDETYESSTKSSDYYGPKYKN